MKFNSLREYFYRIYIVLYVLVLVPLLLFGYVYLEIRAERFTPMLGQDELTATVFAVVILTDWVAGIFLFRTGLKSVIGLMTLRERLEGYARLTIIRFAIICAGSFALGVGFFLTGDPALVALFGISLLVVSLLWPLPAKVCRDLKLKGDERKLVLHRLDTL